MDKDVIKLLEDIIEAIHTVEIFIGEPKLFSNFQKNLMLQHAVERNIEIMGEAMSKILKIDPDINITNARKVVVARNFIIHNYRAVEETEIWSIVIKHLPILKQEVEVLLEM